MCASENLFEHGISSPRFSRFNLSKCDLTDVGRPSCIQQRHDGNRMMEKRVLTRARKKQNRSKQNRNSLFKTPKTNERKQKHKATEKKTLK